MSLSIIYLKWVLPIFPTLTLVSCLYFKSFLGAVAPGKNEVPAAIELELPHAGPGSSYSIYTVSSESGETLDIHGKNSTGYSLLNASDRKFDPMRGGFDQRTAFETVYKAGAKTVGSWSGKTRIIGALSNQISVFGRRYGGLPPKLPKDGETVHVKPSDWPIGNDTLILTFPTRPHSTTFLIIGHPKKNIE